MKKHGLLMILCCVVPLLIIALLPGLRNSGGVVRFLPLFLCVGIHLLMLKGLKTGCHGSHTRRECDETSHAMKDKETQQHVPDETQETVPAALPKPEQELV